jgi:L-amino acid N-acyltransferase YncA
MRPFYGSYKKHHLFPPPRSPYTRCSKVVLCHCMKLLKSLMRLHRKVQKVDCRIRDARELDLAAVQSIYRHYVLHSAATFEEEPPSLDELLHRRSEVLRRGLPYLIAEVNGEVVGYSYATPYRSRPCYRFTVENSVYVDHRLTGQGIGRALLAELIARCEKGQWRQMVAVIGDSNNIASIKLHGSLGFHAVGTLAAVGYKFGRWIDTVLMQRALGADDVHFPY